jgi:hypothetical protein
MEIIAMKFCHTLLCNSYLDVPQGHLWGRFVGQQLQRDQMHKNHCYEFGHTLFCCLRLTLTSAKLVSEVGLLNKSLCWAAALSVTKVITIIAMNLVTHCCSLNSNLDVHQTSLRCLPISGALLGHWPLASEVGYSWTWKSDLSSTTTYGLNQTSDICNSEVGLLNIQVWHKYHNKVWPK